MPLAQFLQSMRGRCRYCEQQAGVLQRDHPECRDTYQAGIQEMVSLVTKAATDHSFNETALRQSLSAIANRSRATDEDTERSLEEGFAQGVAQAMADGIITRDEEERLRAFRDRLALENSAADQGRAGRTGPGRGGPGRDGGQAGSHLRAERGRPPPGPHALHQAGRPGPG